MREKVKRVNINDKWRIFSPQGSVLSSQFCFLITVFFTLAVIPVGVESQLIPNIEYPVYTKTNVAMSVWFFRAKKYTLVLVSLIGKSIRTNVGGGGEVEEGGGSL